MNKVLAVFLSLLVTSVGFAQKVPELIKKEFTKDALAQMVYTPQGDSLTMAKVLNEHKKQLVVLDLWAGWCKDCIAVMDKNKALQQQFPKAQFIYLSLDRSDTAWKKAMNKYQLEGESNYWFKAGWKNKFTQYIDLNWIPRYMVIDKKGKIAGYYLVHPEDTQFVALLEQLGGK
jgi:thiol-disulfide isomerase/thioredoxin